jgi:indole-3-glycerol phosphate synthase
MTVDLNTSLRLSEFVEDKSCLVTESGIKTPADVQRVIQAGFHGVLIGETLMRSENIESKFTELFGKT